MFEVIIPISSISSIEIFQEEIEIYTMDKKYTISNNQDFIKIKEILLDNLKFKYKHVILSNYSAVRSTVSDIKIV